MLPLLSRLPAAPTPNLFRMQHGLRETNYWTLFDATVAQVELPISPHRMFEIGLTISSANNSSSHRHFCVYL